METYENITREELMTFFSTMEKLNEITPEDCVEIFRTVLLGSSDLTKELVQEILSDYFVDHLKVTACNNGRKKQGRKEEKLVAVEIYCRIPINSLSNPSNLADCTAVVWLAKA